MTTRTHWLAVLVAVLLAGASAAALADAQTGEPATVRPATCTSDQTFRSAPDSYVLGWCLKGTGVAVSSGSAIGWQKALVGASFRHCAWVQASGHTAGRIDPAGASCGSSATDLPESAFASQLCDSGCARHAATSCPRYRNVAPWSAEPTAGADPLPVLPAGAPLDWRYASRNGEWVMARALPRAGDPGGWAFVPANCVGPPARARPAIAFAARAAASVATGFSYFTVSSFRGGGARANAGGETKASSSSISAERVDFTSGAAITLPRSATPLPIGRITLLRAATPTASGQSNAGVAVSAESFALVLPAHARGRHAALASLPAGGPSVTLTAGAVPRLRITGFPPDTIDAVVATTTAAGHTLLAAVPTCQRPRTPVVVTSTATFADGATARSRFNDGWVCRGVAHR